MKAGKHPYLRLFEGKDLCVGERAVSPNVVIVNALLHRLHRGKQTKGDCHSLIPLLFLLSNADNELYLGLTRLNWEYALTE